MQTHVSEILEQKGRVLIDVRPEDTVHAAVHIMCERRVGAVIVREGELTPVGIFSERDVMTRVILAGRDPMQTRVSEVMTQDLVAIGTTTTIADALAAMTERRCRHLPVMAKGRVVGMVSIGDLVRHISRVQEYEIRMLTEYVSGSVT